MITRFFRMFFLLSVITTTIVGNQQALAQGDKAQKHQSLYDRLGGLAPISVVLNDLVEALGRDSVMNINPAFAAARKRVPAPYLKYQFTAMVCQATGGPCQYTGRGMKESHSHLNITEGEWERMETIFKEILGKHKVPEKETRELMEIVGSTKADIVVSGVGK